MKAFLSHSSKDKHFVRQVAEILGPGQIEYDEVTFELTLNVEAIRRALKRSSLFVMFLSEHSIGSTFVSEEQRAALEALGRGTLKRIVIFPIDGTSYRALPEWMRETNISRRLTSPKAVARKIQSILLQLDAEEYRDSDLYLGREDDEKGLRRALSGPPKETPLAVHVVGHQGIGRRTFLNRTITHVYPKVFDAFVEISTASYQGIDELYRSLYALHMVSSLADTVRDFSNFIALDPKAKVAAIAKIIREMNANNEFIVINDEGGVYDESGDYQPFFKDLIALLEPLPQPALGIVQTRMMPQPKREVYKRTYHTQLKPLSDETVEELLALQLKRLGIDFTREQVVAIREHLDGHPYNVRFAVHFVQQYGIQSLLNDPSDLLEWKRRRAEDFLSRIEFNEVQVSILAILTEYRYVASDMLISLLPATAAESAQNLRDLEEFCCIERREDYYHVSPPIRDAVRRDKRFEKSDEWKQELAASICTIINDYTDDDLVSVPILETGTMAAARGTAEAPSFLSHLILPSHLLRIARDQYDRGKWGRCIEFCQSAFEMKKLLPVDGQVEVLRLWGLAAARADRRPVYEDIIAKLGTYDTRVARRVRHFLQGFVSSRRGLLDDAEEHFLAAWRLAPENQSVNRELASLFCKQRRFSDAEAYARSAYKIAPTNPFIIDILAETLLGKADLGMQVNRAELERILSELEHYGNAPGSSFYLIRAAQQRARSKDYTGALSLIDDAIRLTPDLIGPHFMRVEILLKTNDLEGAEQELERAKRMLQEAGGGVENEESKLQELEIMLLIERKRFRIARERIESSDRLSTNVRARLKKTLATTIAYDPSTADTEMQQWSRNFRPD